jgi:O-antigen ligase
MTEIGIFLSLAGAILGFWPWSVEPFTLPKLAAILAGALIAHLGLALRGGRNRWANASRVSAAMALWGAALSLSTLFSADWGRSVLGGRASAGGSLITWGALALALSAAVRSSVTRRELLGWAALAGGICGAYAALQGIGIELVFPQYRLAFGGRAFGLMGGPVPLGAVLAACLPAALWLALEEYSWTQLAYAALCLCGLLASETRAALGGAVAGMVLVLTAQGMLRARGAAILVGICAAAAVASRAGALASDVGRLEIWKIACRAILERPWLGWGPDTFEVVMRRFLGPSFIAIHGGLVVHPGAHNAVLAVLYSTGLVGLALAAGAVWTLRGLPIERQDAPAIAALLAVGACSMVNPVCLGALVVAVLLAAPMLRGAEIPAARGTPVCAAALAGLLLAIAVRMTAADVYGLRGFQALRAGDGDTAALEYSEAARLNPFSTSHVSRELDLLRMVAVATPDRELARQTAAAGLEAAKQLVRLHPQDAAALEQLATQLALCSLLEEGPARLDLRRRAAAVMESSVALAPTFEPGKARLAALRRGI